MNQPRKGQTMLRIAYKSNAPFIGIVTNKLLYP